MVAYVSALRAQLRGLNPVDLAARLTDADRDLIITADNQAVMLLAAQGARIFEAYRDGLLAGLDNFQMESSLAAISAQQALAERISLQPVPRTYDVFSRYLVHLYTVVFPFAVIGALLEHRWLVIPATLIIAFAFRIVERIGSVVEAPFGNTPRDVPLTHRHRAGARPAGLLGEPNRPAAPAAIDGYLW